MHVACSVGGEGHHQMLTGHAGPDQDEEGEPKLTVRDLAIAPEVEDGRARVLCARCYSLSHHGCARALPQHHAP